MDAILGTSEEPKRKFLVVGILSSIQFQKCRFLTEKLFATFPRKFAKPEIRPMLNVDWDEYLIKMRRRHGKVFYLLFEPVAVFLDGNFLGDSKELFNFIRKDYVLETSVDFEKAANQSLLDYFQNITNKYKRKFVYLTIAIDDKVLGAMLFMLFNDLVPGTCDNFMRNVLNREDGYRRTRIHRIAGRSFIQCGGFHLRGTKMACENYAVPHDRRGVLSMCNERRHRNNSTQFVITLEPTSWMDYRYVAFGQLIQGGEILKTIESVPCYYQSPQHKILIVNCGEFSLCPVPDNLEQYSRALDPCVTITDGADDDGILSVTSQRGFESGKYYLPTDLHKYGPFKRFSTMFLEYLKRLEKLPCHEVNFGRDHEEKEQRIEEKFSEKEITKSEQEETTTKQLKFCLSQSGLLKAEFSDQVFYFTEDGHVVI